MNLRSEVAEQVKTFEADTPLGRMATVDELVGPAVFLLSDAASFCTGVDLLVDGRPAVLRDPHQAQRLGPQPGPPVGRYPHQRRQRHADPAVPGQVALRPRRESAGSGEDGPRPAAQVREIAAVPRVLVQQGDGEAVGDLLLDEVVVDRCAVVMAEVVSDLVRHRPG